MKQAEARIYVSRCLVRLFWNRLHPVKASHLIGHMLLGAALTDHVVADFSLRALIAHPTSVEPPWEHQEMLLRTWPELLAIGEPYGL